MKFTTRAVHAGEEGEGRGYRPVSTPIYNSSTFIHDSIASIDRIAGGEQPGYMYGRYNNPTWVALETAIASLEEAETGLCFGSGQAAMHAAILASGVVTGDTIVCAQEVYGGTIGLLLNVVQPMGVTLRFADFNDAGSIDQALSGTGVRLVIAETITNPLLRVSDIPAIAHKAHAAGAKLLVDATFTSPALSRPLQQGADYSVHSATKYLSGHGDVLAGFVCTSSAERQALDGFRKSVGGILGPMEAWLVLRGLKTLPLRVERQCSNARRVAEFLRSHAGVDRVYFPGFADHPDHALACRQFPKDTFGAMVSFEIKTQGQNTDDVKAAVFKVLDRLRICLCGTSLGDVQCLVNYPLIASHRELSPKQRQRIGIADNLVRLSVGIEDAGDIIADLDQALRG